MYLPITTKNEGLWVGNWVPMAAILSLRLLPMLRLAKIMRFLELVSFPKTDVVGSNFRPRMLSTATTRMAAETYLGGW